MLTQKYKARVGGQVKRFFPEAVKVEIHKKTFLDSFSWFNKKGRNTKTTEYFFDSACIDVVSLHFITYSINKLTDYGMDVKRIPGIIASKRTLARQPSAGAQKID